MRLSALFVLLFPAIASAQAVDPALPKAPPDWKVEVVAEFPKIRHPSVVCCAPDGRIFLGEDPMDMGEPSNKPVDRVLCIHPDGKITVFAENLYAVFGMQYVDGKLYVHHSPKFSVWDDDNGVGKNRVDLVDCTHPNPWAPGFNDHIPANFRLAMDGNFYFAIGDKGVFGAVGKDGSKIELRGGGLFRMRPDGTALEVVCTGTRNHLDVAINDQDEMFTYDNTDDGNGWWTRVTHMVEGGFYGYPWDYKPQRPYTLWMMTDYKGGSPTGAIAYNEDALPAEYRGNLFLCEWGRGQLLRLKVERENGSYRIVSREDFLTKGSKEFRPVGIAVAPDGLSFYVTDWNYGGWKAKAGAGRLLKVSYTGKSQAEPKPDWFVDAAMGKKTEATMIHLIVGLSHPAQSVRMVAQRRIVDRGEAAAEGMASLLLERKVSEQQGWHAIWAMDAIDGGKLGRSAILRSLKDEDASVRIQAIRQLGMRRAPEATEYLTPLLKDKDHAVRFHAATALGRIGDPAAVSALRDMLVEPNLFPRYAAFNALQRIGLADPTSFATIVKGLESASPQVREGSLFAFRNAYHPMAVAALAGFVRDGAHAAPDRAAALNALGELARKTPAWDGKWWGTQPVKSPPPAKTVDWEGTPAVLEAVRAALTDADPAVRRAAIDAVATVRDKASVPALVELFGKDASAPVRAAVLRTLGAIKDPAGAALPAAALADATSPAEVLIEAVTAAQRIGGKPMIDALVAFAGRADAPAQPLVAALTALGTLKAQPAVPALAGRLKHADAKVRLAAVEALAIIGGKPAIDAVVALLDDPSADIRRSAVGALGTLKAKGEVLKLNKAFLDPQTRFEAAAALAEVPDLRALDAYLFGLGTKNPVLRTACRKAIAAIGEAALPLIESKIESTLLPQDVIGELQGVYGTFRPIGAWTLVGPFDLADTKLPFPIDALPQGEFKGAGGKTVSPKPAKINGPNGRVDLAGQMSPNSNVAAYAFAEIDSPADRTVEFLCGSDDGLVLWLNGEKIFDDVRNRGFKFDQFRPKGKLKAGKNLLAAKITQGSAFWEFAVAIPAQRTGKLFAVSTRKLDPAEYATFATKNLGNAERGKALFNDTKGVACIKCHKVRSEGGDVGPDLASVGAKYNRAQIVESVLHPSKLILDGYRQTLILTGDGIVRAGLVRGETETDVTLVDVEGKKHVIKKEDIDQRKLSDLSLMPEGLNSGLTLQDFADLLAYLESLKDKPETPKK